MDNSDILVETVINQLKKVNEISQYLLSFVSKDLCGTLMQLCVQHVQNNNLALKLCYVSLLVFWGLIKYKHANAVVMKNICIKKQNKEKKKRNKMCSYAGLITLVSALKSSCSQPHVTFCAFFFNFQTCSLQDQISSGNSTNLKKTEVLLETSVHKVKD